MKIVITLHKSKVIDAGEKESACFCKYCDTDIVACDDCGDAFYNGDIIYGSGKKHYCFDCVERIKQL